MSKTTALISGPYATPKCKVGKPLFCRIRGDVPVDGITDAPIQWPFTRSRNYGIAGGRPILILCGDLERAVREESRVAVAHHWGVSPDVVTRWRHALSVAQCNPGTMRAFRDHARATLTDITAKQLGEVKAAIAAGRKPREIEAETGVKLQAIWRIKRGDTFAE